MNSNNNIPVSQTNLGGDRVRDLVEALLRLDQDTLIKGIDYVKSVHDELVIGTTIDTWLDQIGDKTGMHFPNREALVKYLFEAEENEETVKAIRKLV